MTTGSVEGRGLRTPPGPPSIDLQRIPSAAEPHKVLLASAWQTWPTSTFRSVMYSTMYSTINLQVTVNGVTDTETETEVKQFGIYQLTSNINKSLDVSLFHPLTGIESGNIG